jgi:D-alanyl-lipoteichoic acid acyltransferase DltB (MBOAT superfamily)
MTFLHLLVFTLASLGIGLIRSERWRTPAILAGSLISLFWLQSLTPIYNLDVWLPIATISLTVLTWFLVSDTPDKTNWRVTMGIVIGCVVLIGLTRYAAPLCCITPSRPPDLWWIGLAVGVAGGLIALLWRFTPGSGWKLSGLILVLLALLIILKNEWLAQSASALLRTLTGQSAAQASALDIRWLGVSYIFFRLLHVLRDKQIGTLPVLKLDEFMAYVLFWPALTAGPIDRMERFIKDLRASARLDTNTLFAGGWRIALGMFKKYALADTLALIALNDTNARQFTSVGWLWMSLYAYALRIFLDFSGYTDIALGLGRLMGFRLPENFDAPYLKTNLTLFWNSWHMTLAQWFRAYFFNPVSRAMRSSKFTFPTPVIIGVCQFATMLLIGLWHGITWNFVIWGAWHGVGLFVHNRWSSQMQARSKQWATNPTLLRMGNLFSTVLTFHYVALGWVWFVLSETGTAWHVMIHLFGGQG